MCLVQNLVSMHTPTTLDRTQMLLVAGRNRKSAFVCPYPPQESLAVRLHLAYVAFVVLWIKQPGFVYRDLHGEDSRFTRQLPHKGEAQG